MSETESSRSVDRRGFARRMLAALGGLFAALFGIPAAATVFDPALRAASGGWTDAGPVDALTEGAAKRFLYEVRAGWEVRKEAAFLVRRGEHVIALSARCTHSGCTLRLREQALHCPCHGGVFTLDGDPVKGPPRTPLERFETRIEMGRVQVKA